jgi:hypothetical protein
MTNCQFGVPLRDVLAVEDLGLKERLANQDDGRDVNL